MKRALSRLRAARSLGAFSAALLLAAAPAASAPDITGPEARAFLGGRTGKIAFVKNALRNVYFVDFKDSVLTERKVSDDFWCLSPQIHPDGTRVLYESNSAVVVRWLEENSQERVVVYQGTPQNGLSLEPHWWKHPKTGDEYVIFSTGDVAEEEWPPKKGQTFIQKVNAQTSKPEGPMLTMLPFSSSGGRSKNGMWAATSHHSTGMYKLQPDKVDNAFFSSNNWQDSGALLACNASISPSKEAARQDRMMHLTSGLDAIDGTRFENHKAIIIRSWGDPAVNRPLWHMGIPGVRCNNDSSGNLFWEHPEWSTDEDYFTAVGSKVVEGYTDGDLYMGRIAWTGDSQIRRVLKGGGVNHFPHLWVKDGVLPARIRLGKPELSFISLKSDSADPKPDTMAVSNSGDSSTTLPPLKVGALPGWLKVTILQNGTNTPKLVTAVDRSKVGVGDHSATVKITYGQLADSAAYLVKFKYSDPVLTSLKPTPRRAIMVPGDSVRFEVTGLDQTGEVFPGLPAVTWSALDSLPLPASGWIKPDSSHAWSTFRFRAAVAGGPACTTVVVVARSYLRVDAGADTLTAPWISDTAFTGGGSRSVWSKALDLRSVTDPAPASVYRSARSPLGPIAFRTLPDGRYRVRMHFVGVPMGTSALPPLAVKFEGIKLVEDYHPPAATDSLIKGDTREIAVSVSDGNGLDMELEPASAGQALAGYEVWDSGPLPVALTSPAGGETYQVGDTLHIRWTTDGSINSVGIQYSPDSGKSWIPITRTRSVNEGQSDWRNFPWVIPDSLDGKALTTGQGMISVYDYFGTDRDRNNQVFSIETAVGIQAKPGQGAGLPTVETAGGKVLIRVGGRGDWRAALLDASGRVLGSAAWQAPGIAALPLAGLPLGVYRLSLQGPGIRLSRSLVNLK